MRRVLFVCTGNTCRSPMAESILRHLAKEQGVEVEVRSAGVSAWDGTPMSNHAQKVLQDMKMENASFSSQILSEPIVTWADLILTLTTSHKRHLLHLYPEAADKTYTLKEYADVPSDELALNEMTALAVELQIKLSKGEQPTPAEIARLRELQQQAPSLDIQDPFGGSVADYKLTAEEIHAALVKIVERFS